MAHLGDCRAAPRRLGGLVESGRAMASSATLTRVYIDTPYVYIYMYIYIYIRVHVYQYAHA